MGISHTFEGWQKTFFNRIEKSRQLSVDGRKIYPYQEMWILARRVKGLLFQVNKEPLSFYAMLFDAVWCDICTCQSRSGGTNFSDKKPLLSHDIIPSRSAAEIHFTPHDTRPVFVDSMLSRREILPKMWTTNQTVHFSILPFCKNSLCSFQSSANVLL